ncbi:hypothetical protein C2869_22365 (plasmid) [Saccharobesus litoralis]|uniref:Alpha/beta hydrolase n=1 Tax=Saccharobesus litoralis TaxID=2172099 RepID=A0A2S0VYI3_9ALTE|nr:hypothetical protein [Saccharobesus litoralis]AWB69245.1 hypothetical protein C2869_22365 [Saccharobesus litoralis]
MKLLFSAILTLISCVLYAQPVNFVANLAQGSGSYQLEISTTSPNRQIEVHYYKPQIFNSQTTVIIVVAGAGRNANDYRDSWIAHAEKYNLLVLSPAYPQQQYDFAAYHLGGIVTQLKFKQPKVEKHNGRITKYRLKDQDISFTIENDRAKWLFDDFDALFNSVKPLLGAKQTGYDLFGHSAGGQILHRYALFKYGSQANRIVAANSGFYTLPDLTLPFPWGLLTTNISQQDVNSAFSKSLFVLLGEADNVNETRGTLLHTPNTDQQGLGRLERGTYFYEHSQKQAKMAKAVFNWQKILVPDVGHDYKLMGNAAAKLLYGQP